MTASISIFSVGVASRCGLGGNGALMLLKPMEEADGVGQEVGRDQEEPSCAATGEMVDTTGEMVPGNAAEATSLPSATRFLNVEHT
mmetsp:Transcript_138295/g.429955  ORF Transcript_138295/g.429955 Transcript_138295/m.429955 type:complete len:86 (+) Transcript_138295:1380-1637(+)